MSTGEDAESVGLQQWLVEEMHPAMAVPVYIALSIGMLVVYWMVSIIVPFAAPTVDQLVWTVAVIAALLAGWHLRRIYDGGQS